MFLPHKITVERATSTLVGGYPVRTFSVIHTDVPAMVYGKNNGLKDSELGRNSDYVSYEVITNSLDIRVGDRVAIWLSSNNIDSGYLVDNLDVNYSKLNNNIDNIYFTIKKLNG